MKDDGDIPNNLHRLPGVADAEDIRDHLSLSLRDLARWVKAHPETPVLLMGAVLDRSGRVHFFLEPHRSNARGVENYLSLALGVLVRMQSHLLAKLSEPRSPERHR